ncbi:hypothetical protein A6R68_15793, partial [Neotoma lepida]
MAFLDDGNHTGVTEFILLGLTDDPALRVVLFTVILVFAVVTSFSAGSVIVITVFVIAISYSCILITILKMNSTKGRQKAFTTCTSHLTAVILYYGTITFIYVMPKSSYSTDQNKVVSLFYMVVIPMLNPLIYSLRNNEIKGALKRQLVVVITVFVIAVSYIYILITILKMRSTEGRHKAFSTCTSHLTAVTLYYGTITFIYVMPKSSYSTDQNKVVSLLYMVVIPMLNPFIYSLRNNEIKGALKRQL